MNVRLGKRSSPGPAATSCLLRTGTGIAVQPVSTAGVPQRERSVSRAPAVIADRRVYRIARLVWDDVPRDANRRLVRRTKRQRDAYARGRCLGACRAPAHCGAHLVVGRRHYRRLSGDPDDVRSGSGPLHAPAPRTFLTLAAVNWAEARFPPRPAYAMAPIGRYPLRLLSLGFDRARRQAARFCNWAIEAARDSAVGCSSPTLRPASTPRAESCFDQGASTGLQASDARLWRGARRGSSPERGCIRAGAGTAARFGPASTPRGYKHLPPGQRRLARIRSPRDRLRCSDLS